MTMLTQLLHELRTSGIGVVLQNGRVHITAPLGVLTEEMRLRLREHRGELYAWLTGSALCETVPGDASVQMARSTLVAATTVQPVQSAPEATRVDHATQTVTSMKPARPVQCLVPTPHTVQSAATTETARAGLAVMAREEMVRVAQTSTAGEEASPLIQAARDTRVEVASPGPAVTGTWKIAHPAQPVTLPEQGTYASVPALARLTRAETFVEEVEELSRELLALEGPRRVALDLETTGLDARRDRVVSLALGVPGHVSILDLRPYYALPEHERERWRSALQKLLHRRYEALVTWIGQNIKFDWGFLAHHFGVHLDPVYDVMLAEQVLHGEREERGYISFNLRAIAARYGLAVSKEERCWFQRLDQRPEQWAAPFPVEQVRYMLQDIEIPFSIAQKQQPQLERMGLREIAELENTCLPALTAMELHGVLIDPERWRAALGRKRSRRDELAETLRVAFAQVGEETRRPINLNSPRQLIAALARLGIEVSSTSEEVLEEFADNPLVAQLLAWRKLEHFCSAFGENLLKYIQDDGRIHAHFAQIGAVSGRIVCSKPNLQQIPKQRQEEADEEDIRRCFIAPAGSLLIKSDLSNIELRILAEVSRDETMLRLFAEGCDLHAETARLMFHLPPEADTRKQFHQGIAVREIAKTINYGLAYGMGTHSLARRLHIDPREARELIKIYFGTYPGVDRWLKQVARQARAQGYTSSLSGRTRFLPFEETETFRQFGLERIARNHPIQATNADILKRAIAILYDVLPAGAHLVLVVHDEIVLECPTPLVEEVSSLLKEALIVACRADLTLVHIPEPEVLVAPYWKKE